MHKFDNVLICYGDPLVTFLAISSSFFAYYFDAKGAYGIVSKCCKLKKAWRNENPNLEKLTLY